MKIISGRWRGQKLERKVNPKMRPTSNKVREAIFDILESRFIKNWADLRVLDLFAGSGAFGFEALSRGADSVVFVDNHLKATQDIRRSTKEFQVENDTQVICRGVLDAIERFRKQDMVFDLIFLDPPYRQDWVLATLNRLRDCPIVRGKGVVVAEHDKRETLSSLEGYWRLLDSRRYGDTMVSFFASKDSGIIWDQNDEL